jgi:glycine/D-amino acid oxidase-like deaminating enzyme
VAITHRTLEEVQRMAREAPDTVRFPGSLRIASSEAELEDCERQRAQMVADGFACESYDGPEGRGLLIPGDAVFHPMRRCRTVAARAMDAGARLFKNTIAFGVEPGAVRTVHGRIRARHIIVCVDGGLELLVPSLADRVRTARLQMLATAPTRDVSFPRPVSTRDGFDYWQQLPDGSIVLGGGRDIGAAEEWTTDSEPTALIQDYLTAVLRTRLGVQAEVTHRWGARVSYTETGLPIFEALGDGVRVIGAFSGTGNVIGSLLGRAAAQMALTGRSELAAPFVE